MAASITKIYRSSNRARWQPLQTADPTSILVRHMPNSSPGRQTTDTAVIDFLSKNGSGPEYAALRRRLESTAAGTAGS